MRRGILAFIVLGLTACTQDVDDPANFTQGMQGPTSTGAETGGTTSAASASETGGAAEAGNSATSTTTTTTGPAGDSTSGGANTTGPIADGAGNCGNGVIDAGEQCDGADLQGFDCRSLGLGGGTLACDPVMCVFDTSMCMPGGGTGF